MSIAQLRAALASHESISAMGLRVVRCPTPEPGPRREEFALQAQLFGAGGQLDHRSLSSVTAFIPSCEAIRLLHELARGDAYVIVSRTMEMNRAHR